MSEWLAGGTSLEFYGLFRGSSEETEQQLKDEKSETKDFPRPGALLLDVGWLAMPRPMLLEDRMKITVKQCEMVACCARAVDLGRQMHLGMD
ncbi:protein CEPU-1-like protein [Anopheles sinensis]|uniref:Protein CEPU-1-like protein n=1 Tax=Anopheles sinensis TaxID=74873 RepID=A0A084VK44_ANOSI|nr:protein CEPU-1-like protein [Anopheles sinensis]